ncbi:MAG: ABC transporter permease [Saprospiraceae bacterium]|nr:ABC transporter permease [Saprospiraceae bacterium]HMW39186.1 ABC transporter permease [Saprospiraceae bacterium]HMX89286.1 ABC transporter permease [Saprospiraceae bacterium]HMZ40610.1 ABC transporter permease [Saprospiraceae bacterium]HNA63706.1 ABC transporter permease [Saprospiraceae bacterium]
MIFFRILNESLRQALQQLIGNKLRSFLTLLGIIIGIFCIIAVLSSVDSLQNNIVKSFQKLGTDVIFLDKWSWAEDPGQSFWKYMGRPFPSEKDLEAIQSRSKLAQAASFMVFIPGKLVKYQNTYVEGAYMMGITEDYNKVMRLNIGEGRYLSTLEFNRGLNQAIIGFKLAQGLFPKGDGVGREISLYGQKFIVAGVLAEEGKSILNVWPTDEAILVPLKCAKKLVSINSNSSWGSLVAIKAQSQDKIEELKYELASIIRPVRGLRPKDADNFSTNQITLLTSIIDKVFGVVNLAGFAIGAFAMLVGAFGVANIMFVSVKERTSIIGIKMAIGAKRYFILLEYLLEAIILCIVGGLLGLVLVWLLLMILTKFLHFDMFISFRNMLLGVGLSVIVGLLAGFFPALSASRMDPVEAIRK